MSFCPFRYDLIDVGNVYRIVLMESTPRTANYQRQNNSQLPLVTDKTTAVGRFAALLLRKISLPCGQRRAERNAAAMKNAAPTDGPSPDAM
jgi:hypothetical protein